MSFPGTNVVFPQIGPELAVARNDTSKFGSLSPSTHSTQKPKEMNLVESKPRQSTTDNELRSAEVRTIAFYCPASI